MIKLDNLKTVKKLHRSAIITAGHVKNGLPDLSSNNKLVLHGAQLEKLLHQFQLYVFDFEELEYHY